MTKTKKCSKCKQVKPFSEFSTSQPTKKDGHNSWCKQCCRDAGKRHRDSVAGHYSQIKGRATYKGIPFNMSKEGFVSWHESQPKKCGYCDIPIELIPKLHDTNNKGKKINIDRVVNEVGYRTDNIIFSCTRCNYIKSDFFTFGEMRDIAQKYVKPKWEHILGIKIS